MRKCTGAHARGAPLMELPFCFPMYEHFQYNTFAL